MGSEHYYGDFYTLIMGILRGKKRTPFAQMDLKTDILCQTVHHTEGPMENTFEWNIFFNYIRTARDIIGQFWE